MSESIFRIGKMGYPVVPVSEKQRHSDTGIYCVVYDEEKDYGSPFLVLDSRGTSLPGAFDIASAVYFASHQGGYIANTLKDALYRAMTREKAYFGERDIYKEHPDDPAHSGNRVTIADHGIRPAGYGRRDAIHPQEGRMASRRWPRPFRLMQLAAAGEQRVAVALGLVTQILAHVADALHRARRDRFG